MKKTRFLHYSLKDNAESIKENGIRMNSGYVFAFKDDKHGMYNILDMLTWRSFGVDATSWLNMKYAAFNHCIVVFECDINDESLVIDYYDGIMKFERNILPEEIISIENLLSNKDLDNLNRILSNFRDGKIIENDVEELLNISIMFKRENYPDLTNLEYLKICNKIDNKDWYKYLENLANYLLESFINEGYMFKQ